MCISCIAVVYDRAFYCDGRVHDTMWGCLQVQGVVQNECRQSPVYNVRTVRERRGCLGGSPEDRDLLFLFLLLALAERPPAPDSLFARGYRGAILIE